MTVESAPRQRMENIPLEEFREGLRRIEDIFLKKGKIFPSDNIKQVMLYSYLGAREGYTTDRMTSFQTQLDSLPATEQDALNPLIQTLREEIPIIFEDRIIADPYGEYKPDSD